MHKGVVPPSKENIHIDVNLAIQHQVLVYMVILMI